MYTYNNLFDELVSFPNLMRAARNAQRGKRTKSNTARFNFFMEREIFQLQQELRDGIYQPGQYRSFYVYEPKARLISAAPYRDRVVHHALCRIIEPIFEERFIHHSYACRLNKGTHRAIDKCQSFIQSNRYVLKADVQKFFESINHEVLMNILKRWIKDEKVLWLARLIIESSFYHKEHKEHKGISNFLISSLCPSCLCGETGIGLPIGNLTSQFFANVYLNELDYFVKFELREKYYIRYMDDFLIFGNDREHLTHLKDKISVFLADRLKLSLHDKKSTIFPTKDGVNFLGFRIYRDYRRIQKENVKRFVRRMKQKVWAWRQTTPIPPFPPLIRGVGGIERVVVLSEITNSVASWLAHAKHGDTYRLRQKILSRIVFSKCS